MKLSGSCSVCGWFLGVDLKTWRLTVERIDSPTPTHHLRRMRGISFWVGPLCLITPGRFYWTPPRG